MTAAPAWWFTSDPDLCAASLAGQHGISSRRLDAIFAELGLSVERVIRNRRLERAGADIRAQAEAPLLPEAFALDDAHQRRSLELLREL